MFRQLRPSMGCFTKGFGNNILGQFANAGKQAFSFDMNAKIFTEGFNKTVQFFP